MFKLIPITKIDIALLITFVLATVYAAGVYTALIVR